MSGASIEMILLLAVAVFLLVRLIGVLGTRDGFESDESADNVIELRRPRREKAEKPIDGNEDFDIETYAENDQSLANALTSAKIIEPNFRVGKFLQGAKSAYEMIVVNFLKGDMSSVQSFIDPHVFEDFQAAIATRIEAGHEVEVEFMGFRDVELVQGEFDQATNELTLGVRFEAEVKAVVRDKAGEILSGNPERGAIQVDEWLFMRKMGSANPNWTLVASSL